MTFVLIVILFIIIKWNVNVIKHHYLHLNYTLGVTNLIFTKKCNMKYLILLFLVPFEAIEAVPEWQDLQCQVGTLCYYLFFHPAVSDLKTVQTLCFSQCTSTSSLTQRTPGWRPGPSVNFMEVSVILSGVTSP